MKKQVILLSLIVSLIAGVTTSVVISSLSNHEISLKPSDYGDKADTHLVAHSLPAQGSLPDLTYAAEKGVQAVVNIEVVKRFSVYGSRTMPQDPFEFFFGNPGRGGGQQMPQEQEQRGGGSGVIISPDGYIVSNNHVIEGSDEINVTLHDGSRYKAKLIGTDPTSDISLLKIDATGLSTLDFGNSDDLKLGEWVLAIGNPYRLTSTVTAGIISAKGRALGLGNQMGIESFIQTDAAVNPGNSGGALITVDGLLIGINTVIKSPTGSFAGYSFAVPSSIVRKIAADLREYGVVQRAMLGIVMQAVTEDFIENMGEKTGIKERGGVYVAEVTPAGAAEAAGIQKGDVITAIDGVKINTSSEVQEAIAKRRPNDKVNITLKRGSSVKQIEVTLRNKAGKTEIVKKDDVDVSDALGGSFREVSDKQKKDLKISHGIQVIEVKPGGLLAKSRINRGFIITEINDTPIKSVSSLFYITDKIESIDGIDANGRKVSYRSMQ